MLTNTHEGFMVYATRYESGDVYTLNVYYDNDYTVVVVRGTYDECENTRCTLQWAERKAHEYNANVGQ